MLLNMLFLPLLLMMQPPKFEVASIRLCDGSNASAMAKGGGRGGGGGGAPGYSIFTAIQN
jgi:hypothetical protein